MSGALTFTTANWSTAQTVTVTGVDDLVDQGGYDRTATISHTVSGGDYGEVSAGTVSVTVTDDDTAGITVTAADPFTVGEGASATYTVLDSELRHVVTPSEPRSADTDVTGVQNTLTFTSAQLGHSPDGDRRGGPGRRRGGRRGRHRPVVDGVQRRRVRPGGQRTWP